MSNPMEKLKQAKEMLDMGLIQPAEYEAIKAGVMAEMGMSTQTPTTPPPPQHNPLGGSSATMVGGTKPLPLEF